MTPKSTKRTVFFLSDGTGLTAKALGQSLLSQFEDVEFDFKTIPYIESPEKAQEAVKEINQAFNTDKSKPLIFATLIQPSIREIIESSQGVIMDLFKTFLHPLEQELETKSSFTIGRSHGVVDYNMYKSRIDAVNFALANDDGIGVENYKDADIILVGISRSGKTPTCLYLALQFGVYTANYPFTSDDMPLQELPECLAKHKERLFGLIIDPERLHSIRNERRPNSQYAAFEQCISEIKILEQFFKRQRIPYLNITSFSIEEIATKIMAALNLPRRLQ